MGNTESSSSQFPNHGNNNESDRSKKETEEQTAAASSAIKIGAAVAGTALLAFGAWNLSSSSSDSTENKSQKVRVTDRSGLGRAASYLKNPVLELDTEDNGYQGFASRSIKVMSYNVWFREDVEVIKRMEAIGQLIRKHSPDIIFFQEVTPNIYQNFQTSQWWKLYKCSVTPERATRRRYFCMLLSRLPVKRFGNESFEKSNMGREICFAELDAGLNYSLVVATSHLESPTPPEMNSSKRIAQAKEALSHLNYWPNVVFGGDMNWDENSDGPFPLHDGWIDAWTELREAEDGWTYDTKENKSLRGNRPLRKRLDRFLCKLRDFEISDIQMIGREAIPGLSYSNKNKDNPVYPSDHFGLLLTIRAL